MTVDAEAMNAFEIIIANKKEKPPEMLLKNRGVLRIALILGSFRWLINIWFIRQAHPLREMAASSL